jgi:hypothetical protein
VVDAAVSLAAWPRPEQEHHLGLQYSAVVVVVVADVTEVVVVVDAAVAAAVADIDPPMTTMSSMMWLFPNHPVGWAHPKTNSHAVLVAVAVADMTSVAVVAVHWYGAIAAAVVDVVTVMQQNYCWILPD